ncbi:transposase zinc-binding domain-containing protein, partial [Escherichia coli]
MKKHPFCGAFLVFWGFKFLSIEVEAVTKMLACGTRILGVKEFGCDNPDCQHVKYLTNSCGSR